MVVRNDEVPGSAFLSPRRWHKGVTRIVRGLAAVPSAERAVSNARTAALSLSGQRLHREATDRLLAAHAATGRRPAGSGPG